MAKYIDAEALKRDLIDNRGFFPAIVAKAIEDAPAVNVVEVVRGRDFPVNNLIKECLEHSTYDIPYGTEALLIKCAETIHKLMQYVPVTCSTCSHENCDDCDHRLDGWQMKEDL